MFSPLQPLHRNFRMLATFTRYRLALFETRQRRDHQWRTLSTQLSQYMGRQKEEVHVADVLEEDRPAHGRPVWMDEYSKLPNAKSDYRILCYCVLTTAVFCRALNQCKSQ